MSLFETASLVITPNGIKEDKLYAIKPTDGSGDLVVTRATTATLVNSAGLIEQSPYNLLQQSQTFENAIWAKTAVTVTSDSVVAPNGTLTADTILGANSSSYISQLYTGTNGVGYTNSFFIKNNNSTQSQLLIRNTTTVVGATLNWTGSVLSSITNITGITTFQNYGNGWYRIISTYTALEDGQRARIYPTTSTNQSVYLWEAQLVTGSSAKEYFPTTDRLDVPRLDYTNSSCPSILVEPQRTNLVTYSEQLDNAAWVKTAINITANSTTSPDGTTTADKFIPTSATSLHITESSSVSFVSGTTYTFSFYGKKAENNFIQFTASSALLGTRANFDLNSGVLGTVDSGITATITSIGNDGWYRCTATFTASVTGSYKIILTAITNSTAVRFQSFAGNNVNGLFLWGAQLEAGSNATSYIPTVASTVTRNADVISKTGISSLIGQTEGTLFSDFNVTNNDLSNNKTIFAVDDNSYYVNIIGARILSNNFLNITFRANSVTVALTNLPIISNGNHKIAIRYGNGFVSVFVDGVFRNTQVWTNSFTASISQLFIGKNRIEAPYFNDRIKSVQVYKTALTDAECIVLTTI